LDEQRKIAGYHLDGYIEELNLVIEFDEGFHKNFKEKDAIREANLFWAIGCTFYRVSETDWLDDQSKVLSDFETFLKSKNFI